MSFKTVRVKNIGFDITKAKRGDTMLTWLKMKVRLIPSFSEIYTMAIQSCLMALSATSFSDVHKIEMGL